MSSPGRVLTNRHNIKYIHSKSYMYGAYVLGLYMYYSLQQQRLQVQSTAAAG